MNAKVRLEGIDTVLSVPQAVYYGSSGVSSRLE